MPYPDTTLTGPLPDLSEPGKRAIREEYSNALNFSDGEIFRYLRHCSLKNEQSGRVKWLSRLSESKRRDLKQLEKFAEEDEEMEKFRNSLDDLIPYTGLWPALKIGTFHRLLPLRCPEELTQYLKKVKATWDFILGDDKDLCMQLDSFTVQSLEGKCPCFSAEDLTLVETSLDRHEIFSSPCFDAQRDQLLQRLRRVKHLIPSIYTFLEDTKYLEPCARVMKDLLPRKFQGSVRQAFDRQHNGQNGFVEQIDEANTAPEKALGSGYAARWKSYRQLWLFAWRHFPEMTGISPRKDPRKPKPVKVSIEYSWWHSISVLAIKSGYTNISNPFTSADEMMTRSFLRHARPPQLYHFDDTVFDLNVRRICDALKQIQPRGAVSEAPEISSDRDSCGSDVSLRCGRPYEQAFHEDVGRLYLRHVYKDYGDVQRKRHVTSFAVKRAIFHAFFGSSSDVDSLRADNEPETEPPALPVSIAEQRQISDEEVPSLSDARNNTPVHIEERPLSFNHGPDIMQLVPDASMLVHSPSRPRPHIDHREPCIAESWSVVRRMGQNAPPESLLFLTPLSPLEECQFEVKHLRRSRTRSENQHLIKDLKINGAGVEHLYMTHDDGSGCKFIHGPRIVENPCDMNNIIVCAPLTKVDRLKLFWESQQ